MKKTYAKPDIYFENFELSESIAAGCEYVSPFQWQDCPVYDPDMEITIFQKSINGCSWTEDDGEYSTICYHTLEQPDTLFSS